MVAAKTDASDGICILFHVFDEEATLKSVAVDQVVDNINMNLKTWVLMSSLFAITSHLILRCLTDGVARMIIFSQQFFSNSYAVA